MEDKPRISVLGRAGRRGRRLLAVVVALVLFVPPHSKSSLASEKDSGSVACDFTTFSDNFFLGLGACGIEAAKDAGAGALKDVGLNLLKGALQQFAPFLSGLLGGTDPFSRFQEVFAEGVRKILDRLEVAEKNIINSHLDSIEENIVLRDIPAIRQHFATLAAVDFDGKVGVARQGHYATLYFALIEVQQALQNLERVFEFRHLHTLATVANWLVMFVPEYAAVTAALTPEFEGVAIQGLPHERLMQFESRAESIAREFQRVVLASPDGYLTHVAELGRANPFREVAEGQYSDVDCSLYMWIGYAPVRVTCWYDVSPPRSRQDGTQELVTVYFELLEPGPMILEDKAYTYRRWTSDDPERVDGGVVTFASRYLNDNFEAFREHVIDLHWAVERDQNYCAYLIAEYGVVRPALDSLYRLIERTPPFTEADRELQRCVEGYFGAGPVIERLLRDGGDERRLGANEKRWVTNYALVFGVSELWWIWYWSRLDPMATVGDAVDFMKTFGVGTEAAKHYRGVFAAKTTAIL